MNKYELSTYTGEIISVVDADKLTMANGNVVLLAGETEIVAIIPSGITVIKQSNKCNDGGESTTGTTDSK